jgi:hypothetical protein
LIEEKSQINERLDAVLSCTQKDRVESNLSRLEVDSLQKQVETLKLSESRLKREINKLKQ